MRLRENFHRQPLTPLAEAAALQVLYLLENADRMDLGDLSRDILSSEIDGALRSRIAPLRDLLLGNGWSPTRPRVSWSEVLDRHGLDLEPGARKRRLRALSLDESLLTAVQAANLSMRAIEALGTLPVEAQHRIMAAVAVKSDVARMIRHIARMVKLKRYTLDEALEDAMASTGSPGSAEASRFSSYQNRLVADPSHFGDTEVPITSPTHSYDAFGAGPEDAMGDQVSAQGDGDARSSNGRNGVQHGRNLLEGRTNTAVTELLSLSNRVSALLQEIQESALELASGGDGNGITDKGVVTTLPSPWGGYVRTAILLLQGTIDEYSGRLSVP
jgi:hypothetical protein